MTQPVTTLPEAQSDEELAELAGRGSLAAFEALIARFDGRIYAFLRRRCRSSHDLEDLTQTTFLEAWRSIARYSPKWRFSTWLYTIASRQATAWLRRSAVHSRAMNALAPRAHETSSDGADDAAVRAEDRDNLWLAADRALDPVQQEALWLRYAEGFSIEEVARIIDRPAVTTRVILFRARQALKAAISKRDHDAREPVESTGSPAAVRAAKPRRTCEVTDVR